MLSKVDRIGKDYSTGAIANFNHYYDKIYDNLEGSLLFRTDDKDYVYMSNLNKYYNYNRIQFEYKNKRISKKLDSFNQNNILIANKIRDYVLRLVDVHQSYNTILGIGGEYYLYFLFIKASNYIGLSNNKTIIDDANYNIPYSVNKLVDYNNYETFPSDIKEVDVIIINLFNLTEKLIEYLRKAIKFQKIIIISCNLNDKKFGVLAKTFKIKNIKYFQNYKSLIRIIEI